MQITFIVADDTCEMYPPEFRAYHHLAEASNGQVLRIKSKDTNTILKSVSSNLDKGAQILDLISSDKAGNHTIPISVDDTLKDFSISVAGGGPSIVVTNPNNEPSKKAKEIVNLPNVKTVQVKNPEPGEWRIDAGSDTPHTIKVVGISDVVFNYGFSLHSPVKLDETNRRPIFGHPNYFAVSPSDPLAIANLDGVRFFSPDHEQIHPLSPVKFTSLFLTPFMPPPAIFKIEIRGKDASGNPFKRLLPTGVEPIKVTKPQYLGGELEQYIDLGPGKEVELDCSMAGDPKPSITWFKNDTKLPDTSETLTIKSESGSGTVDYRCVGENEGGKANVTFHVNDSKPPEVIDWLMKNKNDSMVTFDEDSQDFLNCPVRGVPEPKLKWLKDGKPLQNSSMVEIVDNGKNVRFKDIKQNATGKYVCVAENRGGKINLTFDVTIGEAPKFEDMEKEMEHFDPEMENYVEKIIAKTDDNVTLSCRIIGNPKPDIFWFKENNPMDFNSERELVSPNGTRYTVPSVKEDAVYYCTANNSNGNLEKQFQIKLPGIPKLKNPNDQRLRVTPNGVFTLNCDTDNEEDDMIEVKWYKDNSPTPMDLQHKMFLNGKVLKIVNATEAEMGKYKCVVSNKAGSAEKNFDVDMVVVTVWTPWTPWTPCDCRSNLQFRSRRCQYLNGTATKMNENKCSGEGVEMRNCNEECDNAGWSDWGSWSPCSATCGEGYKSRSRECKNTDTKKCVGAALEKTKCTAKPCEKMKNKRENMECEAGFYFDIEKEECQDMDECAEDNDCSYSQLCVKLEGKNECICPEGFIQKRFGNKCLDLNECTKKLHGCTHDCVNTRGSYKCKCPDGMALQSDRKTCA